MYYTHIHQELDLRNPKSNIEKLQWLHLYDRDLEYTVMADECAMKDYVTSIVGSEHVITTLGVWGAFDHVFAFYPGEDDVQVPADHSAGDDGEDEAQ